MSVPTGSRIGPYEITEELGAGGMGEVYRATDTNLGRQVAIKVLPESVATDPDRLARFEREAKTLAALNHPNIAQIYGLERTGATPALVMELVDGETLADRIARGPIPIDETLPIAKQIAEALEAAHEQGIIHRDLKPANIKVRSDGTAKVLDFGLAKLTESTAASTPNAAALSMSPTITSPALMSGVGVLLGTAAYMSPEQAKGRPADKRGDIWAFGCVLFEMLTGTRAFSGEDVSDTLAAVLRGEPDWSALPIDVPEPVRALVQRCLVKDRRERVGDISAASFVLKERWTAPSAAANTGAGRPRTWMIALAAAAAVVVFGVAGFIADWRTSDANPNVVTRFSIDLPQGQRFNTAIRPVAISPDGSRIAYVAAMLATDDAGEIGQLFVRPLASFQSHPVGQPISTTRGIFGSPFFSSDGQWIGFWSGEDRTLKKIPIDGGSPVTICKAEEPSGASWENNTIVFAQRSRGIMRVPDSGGEPELIVRVKKLESTLSPQLIDGGRSVLFTIADGADADRWDKAAIVVQSLETGERQVVLRSGADARYVDGLLIYANGTTLWTVPFDERSGRAIGTPAPVIEGVSRSFSGNVSLPSGFAKFAVSRNGTLVYVPGSAVVPNNRMLVMSDISGRQRPLPLPPQPYVHARISPDGTRLAAATDDGKDAVVWIVDDLKASTRARRLTFDGRNLYPIWTPDGRDIVFQSDREGDRGLFRQQADGLRPAERLTKAGPNTIHVPNSWTPDGKTLAFEIGQSGNWSIWTLSPADKQQRLFADARGAPAYSAAFAPDGRWLAYTVALKQGAPPNVMLQPFPATGTMYQVSTNIGAGPAWSADGTSLFYEIGPGAANRLVRVPVGTVPAVRIGQAARSISPMGGSRPQSSARTT